MKKIIAALLILLSVTFTVSAATDVSLAFGASANQFELILDTEENNPFSATIAVNAEADVILDRGNGFYVNLGVEQSNIWIGGGYAYTTPVGNFDMMLTVGPHFNIQQGQGTIFGVDLKTMFMAYFSGVDGMFASFGAKVNMDFVTFGGNQARGYFNMSLLIPEIAIGYKF